MADVVVARPSLLRPSIWTLTWWVSVLVGWGLLVSAVRSLSTEDLRAMMPSIAMIVAIVVLGELRPIVMPRLPGNPVSISLAFVFAVMDMWGFVPASLLLALAIGLSEVLQRKVWWKFVFNVGQHTVSLGLAWLIVVAAGLHPTPLAPHTSLVGSDILWIVPTWVVYHLVNLALVAGLSSDEDMSWWESFTEDFWFYTVSTMAVLALSPLIAIVALGDPGSWVYLPLLLLPLLAVQRTAQMSREREHQALHDPLTGLPNRLLLHDRIEQALARGGRQRGHVVVMFLDVDLFKVVNDGLGHHAGDLLLIELAQRLRDIVRPGDTLARFGGDEFVMVCEDMPHDQVVPLAERIAAMVRRPFLLEGRATTVSASIGIAVAGDGASAITLLRDADAAMYEAKAAGRAQAVVFDEAMHERATARLDLESGLRAALADGRLVLQYQPVVELSTGRPVGLEALVRWEHPTRGLLGPAEFIPVAEETGLIVPMGSWILAHAATCAQGWRSEVPGAGDLWLAVNLSARQLGAPRIRRDVERALESSGLPADALRLEVTESVAMDEMAGPVGVMHELRSLGVRMAIDDFGTGYSSLSYLKRLPVATLKVDRSFVDGLGDVTSSDVAIADAVVSVGRALGLEVIAEGVETVEQRDMLRRLGARWGQGYLWARPLAEQDVPGWLAEHLGALPAPRGSAGGGGSISR